MIQSTAPPLATSSHRDHLVLLEEDLAPQLDRLCRELIDGGHRLLIEHQNGQGPATFPVGDGLRLLGDAGILNTRTVRAVVLGSIEDAGTTFDLDLSGLHYLALASWSAVLDASQTYRNHGGLVHVRAQGTTRRLLGRPTAIETDRTNLDVA